MTWLICSYKNISLGLMVLELWLPQESPGKCTSVPSCARRPQDVEEAHLKRLWFRGESHQLIWWIFDGIRRTSEISSRPSSVALAWKYRIPLLHLCNIKKIKLLSMNHTEKPNPIFTSITHKCILETDFFHSLELCCTHLNGFLSSTS